jgi:hypothetical protein
MARSDGPQGPVATGHTSGVSSPRSDESDTDQRERRRRMRAALGIESWKLLSAGFRTQRNDRQCDGCRVYLVDRVGFRQRLRWIRFMLACSRATRFVGAATRLARLLYRRAGKNARSRGIGHRSRAKRRGHRHRDYDSAQHCFPYNTCETARREKRSALIS